MPSTKLSEQTAVRRIGIYGGSFNPIHTGHCIMSQHFIEQCRLDLCLLIPAYISPFKTQSDNERNQPTPWQRYSMVKSVARKNSRMKSLDWEVRKEGISYTIDTIYQCQSHYPNAEIYLLIGSDQLESFTQWKDWKIISEITTVCCVQRPNQHNEILHTIDFSYTPIRAPLIEVSSTMIRQYLVDGISVQYLVPHSVERYIKKHKLYTQ